MWLQTGGVRVRGAPARRLISPAGLISVIYQVFWMLPRPLTRSNLLHVERQRWLCGFRAMYGHGTLRGQGADLDCLSDFLMELCEGNSLEFQNPIYY